MKKISKLLLGIALGMSFCWISFLWKVWKKEGYVPHYLGLEIVRFQVDTLLMYLIASIFATTVASRISEKAHNQVLLFLAILSPVAILYPHLPII